MRARLHRIALHCSASPGVSRTSTSRGTEEKWCFGAGDVSSNGGRESTVRSRSFVGWSCCDVADPQCATFKIPSFACSSALLRRSLARSKVLFESMLGAQLLLQTNTTNSLRDACRSNCPRSGRKGRGGEGSSKVASRRSVAKRMRCSSGAYGWLSAEYDKSPGERRWYSVRE